MERRGEAGIIAENILNVLTELDPGGEEYYLQNFQTFKTRLDKLDSELRELFRGRRGLPSRFSSCMGIPRKGIRTG